MKDAYKTESVFFCYVIFVSRLFTLRLCGLIYSAKLMQHSKLYWKNRPLDNHFQDGSDTFLSDKVLYLDTSCNFRAI